MSGVRRSYGFILRKAALVAGAFLVLGLPSYSHAQSVPTKLVDPAAIEDQLATAGKTRVIVHLANDLNLGVFARMLRQKTERSAALTQIRTLIDAAILRNFPAGRTAAGSAIKRFALLPSFAAEISRADLARLQADPNVIRIEVDELKKPVLNATIPLIGLPSGGNSPSAEPSGYGRTVAIIDTGVQSSHPFLSPRVIAEACFVTAPERCPNGSQSQTGPGAAAPASGAEHGTHVSGIAIGSYAPGSPVYRGVANRANLVMVNVFGGSDSSYTSDIIRGLEFIENLVSTNGNPYKIDAVNISIGSGRSSGNCDSDPEKPIIDLLRSEGVLTVAAAGNDGWRSEMSAPACISSVVSVAATNKQAGIASYTNLDSNTTLFAPGGDFDTQGCVTSSVPQSRYKAICGTSMAAPHVAAAISLLRQANPAATPSEILAALTASNMPTVTDTRTGGAVTKPFLRVDTALANLRNQVLNSISVSKGVSGSVPADGVVTSSPGGISCGPLCTSVFPAGSRVTLTADASPRSRFAGWTGACSGAQPSCTVTVPSTPSAGLNVTALFSDATVPLATALDDTLTWTSGPNAGDVGGWFGQTTVMRSGDTTGSARSAAISDGQSSSIQTTVTGPGTLSFYWSVSSEADYDFLTFYIDGVRQSGRISGSVGFTQQTWSIPAGNHVLRWTYAKDDATAAGADAGYLDTVIFTPSQAQPNYTLTLKKKNSSYGAVTSSPAGLSCGRSCKTMSASFVQNTKVTLTARASAGRRFASWSGACSGSKATCTVNMSSDKAVTATFR